MAIEFYLSDAAHGISDFLKRVDDLIAADAGCEVNASFENIRRGWSAVDSGTDTASARQAITAAVIEGDAEGVRAAVAAFTVASVADPGSYRSQVARDVIGALREAYAETAGANYGTIAARFDEAAARMTAAAKVCDVSTSAEAMVSMGAKERTAWTDAALATRDLDALLPLLGDAAELAKMMPAPVRIPEGSDVKPSDWTLALACDPGTAHRRRVWEAWQSRGDRCGRWGALVALGVTLRACPLDDFTVYARPRPMETRTTSRDIGGGVSGFHQVPVDPEDQDYKPASPTDDPAAAREAEHNQRLAKAWSKAGKGDTAETEAPTAGATT